MRFPWLDHSRLWLVTDKQTCKPKTVSQVVGQVVHHGIDVVVFRDKVSTVSERRKIAPLVQEQCKQAEIPFVVAHDLELAIQLKAHAIHLGINDIPIAQIRTAVGDGMAIGYSSHSVDEANDALLQGADYVFLGPIFASPEKLKLGNPLGADVIRDGNRLPGTVVFIGGMDETTIQQAIGQGAKRFAAIRAFQAEPKVVNRVRSIARLAKKS